MPGVKKTKRAKIEKVDRVHEILLRELFRERGYAREPSRDRRNKEGREYKKGYEVRLSVWTQAEARRVRRALRVVGLKPGSLYEHHSFFVQPVYGKDAVDWFKARRQR